MQRSSLHCRSVRLLRLLVLKSLYLALSGNNMVSDQVYFNLVAEPLVPLRTDPLAPQDPRHTRFQKEGELRGGSVPAEATLFSIHNILVLQTLIGAVLASSLIIYMMPGGGGGGGRYREPPSWGPEREREYSFRTWLTDLTFWVTLTDLAPHQQVSAIVLRLTGVARDVGRNLTSQEVLTGGFVNGQQLDPVSYLIVTLHARFANLEEETRITAMTEFLAFARRPGEAINDFLARYEIVRQRATVEGRFQMTVEGCALQVFRALGTSPSDLVNLLQPFGNRYPHTEQELSILFQTIRRQRHITENHPGNVAQSLSGPFRQARPNAYYGQEEQQQTFFGTQQNIQATTQHAFWNGAGAAAAGYDHGGGVLAEADTQQVYASDMDGVDSGTDTETSSDSGNEPLDAADFAGWPEAEVAEHIYMQYRNAKRVWRRFTKKPVRKFRRGFKRFRRKGSGKGKGSFRSWGQRGKGSGFFLAEPTEDEVSAFVAHKGRGKGKSKGSGKGFGRKGNPKDRNGNVMKCRICNSEEHFAARCPQKGGGKGPPPMLFTETPSTQRPNFAGFVADPTSWDYSPPWQNTGLAFQPPLTSAFEIPTLGAGSSRDFSTGHQTAATGESVPAETGSRLWTSTYMSFPDTDPFEFHDPWADYPRPYQAVMPDDELSSAYGDSRNVSREATPERSRPQTPGTDTGAQIPYLPERGFTTPIMIQPQVPVTLLPPTFEDRTLQGLVDANRMRQLNNTRPVADPFRPIMNRHNLPLSSTGATGAFPSSSVSLPTEPQASFMRKPLETIRQRSENPLNQPRSQYGVGPPPEIHISTLQNMLVQNSQRLADVVAQTSEQNSRMAARMFDLEQQVLNLTRAPRNNMSSPRSDPGTRRRPMQMSDPNDPVHNEGAGDVCPLCQDDFGHGQRMVRLECRHMFHGECYEQYLRDSSLRGRPSHCPNCRGRGRISATWSYVGPEDRREGEPLHADEPAFVGNVFHIGDSDDEDRAGESVPAETSTTSGDTSFVTAEQAGGSVLAETSPASVSSVPSESQSTPSWVSQHIREHERERRAFGFDQDTGDDYFLGNSNLESYHADTRLVDGRPSILIDPGSVGNLCGDEWARSVANAAAKSGYRAEYKKRDRPLSVRGVGSGSQSCTNDCYLPMAFRTKDGTRSILGNFTTPCVQASPLPGLMGLQALRRNKAVIDFNKMEMHFMGEADYELLKEMPPGTDSFQLEIAPLRAYRSPMQ